MVFYTEICSRKRDKYTLEKKYNLIYKIRKTWQKHHKKVISLENQIHTVQKRIDKAHMDKAYCESKMAS